MSIKILVIGSTGKLGIKLLNFCHKNLIPINGITCHKNNKLILKQSSKFHINNKFCLSDFTDYNLFTNYIKFNKLDIIYFLDHGSNSLKILSVILAHQRNCNIAIANKEMIIAGNNLMINNIKKSKNIFYPLDSEHFSLINSKLNPSCDISKIYITASGGPFYFKKNIDLKKVEKTQVLSHPKWKMGNNNLIDSSNFINKVLEIFELSIIYKIDIQKIDFLISPAAFVHSVVIYNDYITCLNCFNNEMLITLTYPLRKFYNFKLKSNIRKINDHNNFYLEKYNDNRFKVFKYLNKLKKLNHSQQIKFMILNNLAQKLYLNNKLKYNDIFPYILKNLHLNNNKLELKSFSEIINYIELLNKKYESHQF